MLLQTRNRIRDKDSPLKVGSGKMTEVKDANLLATGLEFSSLDWKVLQKSWLISRVPPGKQLVSCINLPAVWLYRNSNTASQFIHLANCLDVYLDQF